jgi:hypothetical protein
MELPLLLAKRPYRSVYLRPRSQMQSSIALALFRVQVYKFTDREYFIRKTPTIEDSHPLESLFEKVSRELAKPNNYRLLAPFLSLITPEKYHPSQFSTAPAWTEHYLANSEALDNLADQLRQRFANKPLTILIVDTKKSRWAAFSPLPGLEATIIVEQRLVRIIKLGGPESRLFGFMVAYNQFGHFIRNLVSNLNHPSTRC